MVFANMRNRLAPSKSRADFNSIAQGASSPPSNAQVLGDAQPHEYFYPSIMPPEPLGRHAADPDINTAFPKDKLDDFHLNYRQPVPQNTSLSPRRKGTRPQRHFGDITVRPLLSTNSVSLAGPYQVVYTEEGGAYNVTNRPSSFGSEVYCRSISTYPRETLPNRTKTMIIQNRVVKKLEVKEDTLVMDGELAREGVVVSPPLSPPQQTRNSGGESGEDPDNADDDEMEDELDVEEREARMGDPVCDSFGVEVYQNRIIFALADGCNWGERPREAARVAVRSFIDYLKMREILVPFHLKSVDDIARHLTRALGRAHTKICDGPIERGIDDPSVAGTTTLLGGILIEVYVAENELTFGTRDKDDKRGSDGSKEDKDKEKEKEKERDEGVISPKLQLQRSQAGGIAGVGRKRGWAMLCVSAGDCKLYHYSVKRREVTDVTGEGSRVGTSMTDPGGRLGPYVGEQGLNPDLRNMSVFLTLAEEGDMFVLCSDGVHDNLDPEVLGRPPLEFGVQQEDWEKVHHDITKSIKTQYATDFILHAIERGAHRKSTPRVDRERGDRERDPGTPDSGEHPTTVPEKANTLSLPVEGSRSLGTPPANKPGATRGTRNRRSSSFSGATVSPKDVVERLLWHCKRTTKKSREWMQDNPSRRLPLDYLQFPGKMDHTTCLCIRVGRQDQIM